MLDIQKMTEKTREALAAAGAGAREYEIGRASCRERV